MGVLLILEAEFRLNVIQISLGKPLKARDSGSSFGYALDRISQRLDDNYLFRLGASNSALYISEARYDLVKSLLQALALLFRRRKMIFSTAAT